MFVFRTKGEKVKWPYFILLFIGAILVNSYHLVPAPATSFIVTGSKHLLILTLFLVGSTISIGDLKKTGVKPLTLAVLLWVFISILSLAYILY